MSLYMEELGEFFHERTFTMSRQDTMPHSDGSPRHGRSASITSPTADAAETAQSSVPPEDPQDLLRSYLAALHKGVILSS